MLAKKMMEMVAQGMVIEMAKYHQCGQWGTWKKVDLETALRKARVVVTYEDEFGYEQTACPYTFRFVEA